MEELIQQLTMNVLLSTQNFKRAKSNAKMTMLEKYKMVLPNKNNCQQSNYNPEMNERNLFLDNIRRKHSTFM